MCGWKTVPYHYLILKHVSMTTKPDSVLKQLFKSLLNKQKSKNKHCEMKFKIHCIIVGINKERQNKSMVFISLLYFDILRLFLDFMIISVEQGGFLVKLTITINLK